MADAKTERDQEIRDIARKLAERLASDDGARAIAKAAEATRLRAAETSEAARLDPKLLQKRVTF
jgi:hypothetical protein